MSRRFENQVAVVTGASSGIGKATALQLAAEGAAVCIVANRNVEGGEATRGEIADAGGRALFVQADVSVAADCDRVVEQTLAAFGQLDVLVNNAGITRFRRVEEIDEALWDQVMDTNLKSAYLMAQRVLPSLLERGRGAIVNVASVHAEETYPGGAVYAASKAGLCGLTRALALELGSRGIRVNCVLPGTIDTTLYHRSNRPVDREAWAPHRNPAQVLQREGSPDEIAAAICFLASDEASFVNGASLAVDGGLLVLLRDH
ncbi:MAG: SDR family oxidoreductase [Armatimonadetes bacterium]|nr:SDR family oxidoreductase [Armatimonadota bacterium]